ncbi:MAG: hypothetical protein K1000chlam2_00293, partial [Chlamydiae bacterium]|nr:hypothetical protein [Chlamydiota bacterium]
MQDDFSTSPIEPTDASRIQKHQRADARKMSIAQEASKINMIKYGNEAAFNPVMMSRRFETLEEKRRREIDKKELEKAEDKKILAIEKVEEIAEEFNKRNAELEKRSLQLLYSHIKESDSQEEILRKAMQLFPDHSLADEALEFLDEATAGDLKGKVAQAKENLNETYGREVRAGRNINAQAQAFSEEGLGTPTGLRDLYRDITGNPRDATTLFGELNEMFNYEKMNTAIDFILHSLGADLKSKGPSIAPGEL